MYPTLDAAQAMMDERTRSFQAAHHRRVEPHLASRHLGWRRP